MLSQRDIQILRALLHATHDNPSGVNELRFCVDHRNDQGVIDELISKARIQRKMGKYLIIRPLAVAELASLDPIAQDLHARSAAVYDAVLQFISKNANPADAISVANLQDRLKTTRPDLVRVLTPLLDTGIFATHSNDLNVEDAYVTPSVKAILRHGTYDGLIQYFRDAIKEDATSSALQAITGEVPAKDASAETLTDRWTRKLKNNRVFAVLATIVAAIAVIATVIENSERILKPFRSERSPPAPVDMVAEIARDPNIRVDLCILRTGQGAHVECLVHGDCSGEGSQGAGYFMDSRSKEAAVLSCQQACVIEARQLKSTCLTSPPAQPPDGE